MTTRHPTAHDAATTDRLKLLQADIHAASVMGNTAEAARLTMRYFDESTDPDYDSSTEPGNREL